jgi:hypothetical protein
MGNATKKKVEQLKRLTPVARLGAWLVFAYLVVFPFGQLLRYDFYVSGFRVALSIADVIVAAIFLFSLACRLPRPKIFKYLVPFFLTAAFSLIFSLTLFPWQQVILGSLYLLRLVAYSYLLVLAWNLARFNKDFKERLFKALITVSAAAGVFGWLQYAIFPDLRFLKDIGWDDHLYRLIGTYLDPTFTALILVFGFLLSLAKFFDLYTPEVKSENTSGVAGWLVLSLFFLVSVIFTYSRASFLALLIGVGVILFYFHKIKIFPVIFIVLLVVILFVPKSLPSEGVHLTRVNSLEQKLVNISETTQIIKVSPVLGIGFNNFCFARAKFLGDTNTASHGCTGADVNFLFILATTGITGFFAFIYFIIGLLGSVAKESYGFAFLAVLSALLTHSFFAASLFYPFILGFLFLLLGVALKKDQGL